MTEIKPGDRVRVTYETFVDPGGHFRGESTLQYYGATVEVIEPADDPSKDPVGTVRRTPRTLARQVVKVRRNYWVFVRDQDSEPLRFSDTDVREYPVVGAVPE
jgi:hypothetical protein